MNGSDFEYTVPIFTWKGMREIEAAIAAGSTVAAAVREVASALEVSTRGVTVLAVVPSVRVGEFLVGIAGQCSTEEAHVLVFEGPQSVLELQQLNRERDLRVQRLVVVVVTTVDDWALARRVAPDLLNSPRKVVRVG